MRLIIPRTELVNLIGKIQSVVPSKPAIPILSNILFEAEGSHVRISATDLTVSMRAYSDAKVIEAGAVTLPARRFFQLIRELTAPQIEIHATKEGIATILAGTSQFKLHGMDRSEFPTLPDLSGEKSFSIPSIQLKDMLGRTAFAAAKDDSRQILNGIFTELQENRITFVGTDGKRLAKVHGEIDFQAGEKTDFVMPLKAVEEMVRILDNDQKARFIIMNDKVALESGSICLITKLLAGQYPDVDRVIPDSSLMKVISLHKEELSSLLKQISLFTSEMNYSVRFTFDQGDLKLQAMSSDIGEGKVNMPVDYNSDRLDIAFNPYFFLDILRHCKDETAQFAISDSYNPGLITDSSNALYVIMPMRLSAE
jgi:DNA polymerase-3 subunit beta